MANPVVVEVTRGDRVEFRPSRRRRGGRRGGSHRHGLRRRGAGGLSALGGQGAAGLAAHRKRRGRPLGAERPGNCAGLRVPFRQRGSCRDRPLDAGQGRPRRERARMRRALAARRSSRPGARALRRNAERVAQQLLRQTRRLHLRGLGHGRRSQELCRAGSSGSARGRSSDRGGDRRETERGDARRRRLRHSNLRHTVESARAWLRALRDGPGAFPGPPARRRRAFAQA